MKNIWFLSIFFVSLYSCDVYNYNNDNRVESILAVTEAGDTIAVPYRQFLNDRYTNYTRFNYNNNWYYNNWRYDYSWRYNYWYSQLDQYNRFYIDRYNRFPENGGLIYNNNNNNNGPTGTQTNVNSRRGQKVTNIPTPDDGIYVPPKPPTRLKNDVKIIRNNTRIQWPSQSRNNGGFSRSRQVFPSQPATTRQFNSVQPGQVRGGSRSSIPQQSRSSQPSSGKGRSSSGKIQN